MKRGLIIVSLGYWLSRVFFYVIGIRFLGLDNLNTYLQIIDPPLLEHHLLSSLYYSSFPPLYNLILGVMLKLFGASAPAFAALHVLVGWALALVLFALMADLGIRWRLAVAATLLYMILPPVILYENWLFYTYIETLLFTLAAWSFLRFMRRPAIGWGLALFSCYTALALLNARMMFFAFIIAFLLWWPWRGRRFPPPLRRLVALSATPILIVLLVMTKNAWLFGAFTMDPHFGFHMGNGFIYSAWRDPATHAVCVQDYPILLIPPTKFPTAQQAGLPAPARVGIPLLDDLNRSGGQPNYNNLYYLEVSKLYTEDLTDFVAHHPLLYARFVKNAFLNYWQPSNHYLFFPDDNRRALGAYDTLYTTAYPLLLVLYFAGTIYALTIVWQRRGLGVEAATLAFILATIAYTMLAVFVTYGENDRYKFTIEPMLWVLDAYVVCSSLWPKKSGPSCGLREI
jgi:hypothetical protein